LPHNPAKSEKPGEFKRDINFQDKPKMRGHKRGESDWERGQKEVLEQDTLAVRKVSTIRGEEVPEVKASGRKSTSCL